MKAITYDSYGGPKVLELNEVTKPAPKSNQILIRNQAVSLNPYDWHYMRGEPRFVRLMAGFTKPKVNILGNDVAGVVEAVGSEVTVFQVGDSIIGSSKLNGFAEYVAVDEDRAILKPDNMSTKEAAGLNIAAVTALESIDRYGKVRSGQEVLVNGASGGVGHYAVQIAKARGAKVTGVCSGKNIELVKSLGADDVIDYTKESINTGKKYDVVIDTIGNLKVKQLNDLCKSSGEVVAVGFQTMKQMFKIMLRTYYGKPNFQLVSVDETVKELSKLKKLAEEGKIRTHIDRTYPFHQLPEAMDYVEQGHARGKVIVTVDVD